MPVPNQDIENDEPSAEQVALEKEAVEMGWLPKEKFKGPEDRWVPAEEYVEKGRHVIPIIKADRDRLRGEVLTRDAKIGTLAEELKNVREGLGVMEKHFKEDLQRKLVAERTRLKAEYKEARTDNDVDAELRISDELKALDASEADIANIKIAPPAKADGDFEKGLSPDYKAWEAENPWFNVDKKRTRLITLIAEDLAKDQPNLKGRAFFDECSRLLEEEHPSDEPTPGRRESKVEGGNGRSARSGAKGFADLPADAKAACMEDVEKLVGPKKLYKTADEYKKYYTNMYFSE